MDIRAASLTICHVVPKVRQGSARKVPPLSPDKPTRQAPHRLRLVSPSHSGQAGHARRPASAERVLRCVSSGYLTGGRSCQASVPAGVVSAAWAGELARSGECSDRLFNFLWRGQEWLGFGLADGEIRGVYCPVHSAQRAANYYAQRSDGRAESSSLAS